jgi:hypothetical protein
MAHAFNWAEASRNVVSALGLVADSARHRATGMRSKEKTMNTGQRSLRLLVEKWLAPTPAMLVRVTRFSRTRSNQRRYVCVEASRPAGSLAIFFFRHDDGSWCVFPPATERPAMRADPRAA